MTYNIILTRKMIPSGGMASAVLRSKIFIVLHVASVNAMSTIQTHPQKLQNCDPHVQANTNGLQLKIIFLTGPQAPQILTPNDDGFGSPPRIIVGGESNRWLNISFVVLIGGIEDHDSKIFMCEVCLNHSTPAEECYTANYTSWLVGAPPNINGTSPRKLSKI